MNLGNIEFMIYLLILDIFPVETGTKVICHCNPCQKVMALTSLTLEMSGWPVNSYPTSALPAPLAQT